MKRLVVLAWLVSQPIVALAQDVDSELAPPPSDQEAVSQTERNKALAMRFYEEAWHNDNYTIADEIFAPDYIRHDASDPVQGPGEAVLQSERTREVKEIVPDLRYEYDVVIAVGTWLPCAGRVVEAQRVSRHSCAVSWASAGRSWRLG